MLRERFGPEALIMEALIYCIGAHKMGAREPIPIQGRQQRGIGWQTKTYRLNWRG